MKNLSKAEIRAARLSRLPGISMAEACELTGAHPSMVTRARRKLGLAAYPSKHDLALAVLTHCGRITEGPFQPASNISSFIDLQSHDGTTPQQAQQLLDELVERGVIAVDGTRFRLLVEWPSGLETAA